MHLCTSEKPWSFLSDSVIWLLSSRNVGTFGLRLPGTVSWNVDETCIVVHVVLVSNKEPCVECAVVDIDVLPTHWISCCSCQYVCAWLISDFQMKYVIGWCYLVAVENFTLFELSWNLILFKTLVSYQIPYSVHVAFNRRLEFPYIDFGSSKIVFPLSSTKSLWSSF
jgi:hypothetical protein